MVDYTSASGVVYSVVPNTGLASGTSNVTITPPPPGLVTNIARVPNNNIVADNRPVTAVGVALIPTTYVTLPGSESTLNIFLNLAGVINFYIGGNTTINNTVAIGGSATINVAGGTATLSEGVAALGTTNINISSGGTFDTGPGLASLLSTSKISFGDGGGTLVLNGKGAAITLLNPANPIGSYDPSTDVIMLKNTVAEVNSYTIENVPGTTQKKITLSRVNADGVIVNVAEYVVNPAAGVNLVPGTYIPGGANDPLKITYANGNTYIGKCFLAGTMIRTPDGLIAVEDIKVGDQVITFDWQQQKEVVVPVSWVGKSHAKVVANLEDDLSGFPVRILKDAIAEGVPYKDMLITAEHSLFFEGKFVPVRMLVNSSSIFYDKTITDYDYYHIETESHSVITADGVLTESYLHTNNHMIFKSQEAPLKQWNIDSCAPLCVERDFVESIYNEIQQRAEEQKCPIQFGCNYAQRTDDYGIFVTVETGEKLKLLRSFKNSFFFLLPSDVHEVSIHSYSNRPCDSIGPFVDDRRHLGVLVENITIFDGDRTGQVKIHLTKENLAGWHGIEHPQCRWTNGEGYLPLRTPRRNKKGILQLTILSGGPYLVDKNQDYDVDVIAC